SPDHAWNIHHPRATSGTRSPGSPESRARRRMRPSTRWASTLWRTRGLSRPYNSHSGIRTRPMPYHTRASPRQREPRSSTIGDAVAGGKTPSPWVTSHPGRRRRRGARRAQMPRDTVYLVCFIVGVAFSLGSVIGGRAPLHLPRGWWPHGGIGHVSGTGH